MSLHVRSEAAAFSEGDPSSHPLDPETRSYMEQHLGRNLDDVRIRSGKAAAASASWLGADAYARGRTIVLGHGYQADAPQGRWLLAHELVHAIQQSTGRGAPAHADAATLERIANAAADIVASGGSLSAGFDFGSAPYGMIQRHLNDTPCTGTRYNASAREIWMAANNAIEQAYRDAHLNNSIFFGSDFEDSLLKIGPEGPRAVPNRRPWREGPAEVALPKGVKEKSFGNILLRDLRGLERQRRPDIVDFTARAFYEIKSTGYEDRGQVQLQSYYKITETILMHHGVDEPPWRPDSTPYWYPKHVLPMWSPDPRIELAVCTEATDYARYPGMIIYEVRRLPRRRRRQRTQDVRMYDFWNEYDSFRPAVDASLKKGIQEFDPSSPDYVIIVPNEFFQIPAIRQITREAMEPRWDKFRVQPEIARRRLILDPRVTQFWLGVVCIVGGAAIIVVSAGAFAPAAAGAGAVVAVEMAGATTAATAGIESTIIVPASMAAQVAGTTAVTTTTEAISVATYNAMLGSATIKAVAATAGVLLIVGSAKGAQASTGRAEIDSVIAFRAVPVNDFTDRSGTLYADSNSTVMDNMYSDKDINDKFNVGAKVYYNNQPHWIFGRVAVK
jgi:hypothetical protein